MKKIAIAIIGILLALYLAAYGPWRTGGQKGGLNVAQDGSQPATGAQNVNQSVKDVQQPVKEGKQRVTGAQGAKRHGKGVTPSVARLAAKTGNTARSTRCSLSQHARAYQRT